MKDDVKISIDFTVGDWKKLRPRLKIGSNDHWDDAFKVFQDKIDSRFLIPIEKIKSIGKNTGEGFSIALISVVLLEFIAAFEYGRIYNHKKNELCPNEYYDSVNLLKLFFKYSNVFQSQSLSNTTIQRFYDNIRCGLVHQARTMRSDIIISENSTKNVKRDLFYFAHEGEYRLNRDLLLKLIKYEINNYREIIVEQGVDIYRKSFLIKIDELAGLDHAWYFNYESNLNNTQLTERLNNLNDTYLFDQRCCLNKYTLVNNIKGRNKEYINEEEDGVVEGTAYLILKSTIDSLLIEDCKKGFQNKQVQLIYKPTNQNGAELCFNAYTYII